MRSFMHHWKNRLWRSDVNPENEPITGANGNIFSKRGISAGDVVYVVTLREGQLYLGGRITVGRIGPPADGFEAAERIEAENNSGTRLKLHRRLVPVLSEKLHIVSKDGESRGLRFVTPTDLDRQALRVMPELTPASAALLDLIIEKTDSVPPSLN